MHELCLLHRKLQLELWGGVRPKDRHLEVRLGEGEEDRLAAARLRYAVFVEEMGGDGPLVDHGNRFEQDRFDPYCDHMILVDAACDPASQNHVVGVYRLMTEEAAQEVGQFYSEDEYDLTALKTSGRRLLELGRSCVAKDHRGGQALGLLWDGLADYVISHEIEVMFGVASFHGTDVKDFSAPLSHLYYNHLAPTDLRVRAHEDVYQRMDLLPDKGLDRVAAMRDVPSLMKSYLRLGGFVGDGAFIDHSFNTTDVCLVLDTQRMNAVARARYGRKT